MKPINASRSTENGIITLFGVASDAVLFSPTSFVATNQYYQANISFEEGVNPMDSTEKA